MEADFADGAFFVSLAAVQRPEDVPGAIVSALGIIVLAGESPSQAAERFLAAKDVLLVADNFEHVVASARFIGALLGSCPGLTAGYRPRAARAARRGALSRPATPAARTRNARGHGDIGRRRCNDALQRAGASPRSRV